MKTRIILLSTFLFLIFFISSCDRGTVNPSDVALELRKKGGNKPDNPGNDSDPKIYRVEYHGDLQATAYGEVGQNNKKAQLINAGQCTPFVIRGIPGLVGGCFTDPLSNIWGPGIRLIDRRKDEPDMRVSARLFISYNGDNHWVNFIGSICCNGTCNDVVCGNTILPEDSGEQYAIWVKMDRMIVESSEGCNTDRPLTAFEDVRIKIILEEPDFQCP